MEAATRRTRPLAVQQLVGAAPPERRAGSNTRTALPQVPSESAPCIDPSGVTVAVARSARRHAESPVEGQVAEGSTGGASSSGSQVRAGLACGTGYIDGLSPPQDVALGELRRRTRERTTHPRFHDLMLLRFLRARKFEVEAAWRMFSEHLDWRENTGLDRLPEGRFSPGAPEESFPELPDIKRHYPHGFHGQDREGRPIYIERLGRLSLPELLATTSAERVAQYFAHELERVTTHRLLACSLAQGRLIEKTLTVLDLEGLSLRTVSQAQARRMLQAITKVQQSHYPELMGEMIIVNAPRAFHLAWKFACPMIDCSTVQKIRGLQEDPCERLRELVEPSNLPRFLGGECECAGGCLASDLGPWQDPAIVQELAAAPHWEIWGRLVREARGEGERPGSGEPPASPSASTLASSLAALGQRPQARRQRAERLLEEVRSLDSELVTARATGSSTPSACSERSWPSQASAPDLRREGREAPPSPAMLTARVSSQDRAPLWQKVGRMEDVYISVLEDWLARAPHLKGSGSVQQIQEVQRYFDNVATAQRSQAEVHTVAAEFYKLMVQNVRLRDELQALESRMPGQGPQGSPPSGAFVEQALRVAELMSQVSQIQERQDRLEAEFRRGIADFRRARGRLEELEELRPGGRWRAAVHGTTSCCARVASGRERLRLLTGCCPSRWGCSSDGGCDGAAVEPAAALREALDELDLNGARWQGGVSEANEEADEEEQQLHLVQDRKGSLSTSARSTSSSFRLEDRARSISSSLLSTPSVLGSQTSTTSAGATVSPPSNEAPSGSRSFPSEEVDGSQAPESDAGDSFCTCESQATLLVNAIATAAGLAPPR